MSHIRILVIGLLLGCAAAFSNAAPSAHAPAPQAAGTPDGQVIAGGRLGLTPTGP